MQIRVEIVKERFNEMYRKTGDQVQSSVRQTERGPVLHAAVPFIPLSTYPCFGSSCSSYPLHTPMGLQSAAVSAPSQSGAVASQSYQLQSPG